MNDYMPGGISAPSPGGFLIVDDVAINIYITREILLPYGLPIDSAESGPEAIDKIKSGNVYDIIFMDHMMPQMNGPEATEIIRSMGYTGCIVALTANAGEDYTKLYVASGFNRSIAKPIEKEKLDDLVNEFIDIDFSADDDEYENGETSAAAAARTVSPPAAGPSSNRSAEMCKLFVLDAEYAVEVLEDMLNLPHAFTDEEMDTYEITVHGMKSALLNVDRHDVSGLAYKLEQAAKQGDIGEISRRTPELVAELKKIIAELKASL